MPTQTSTAAGLTVQPSRPSPVSSSSRISSTGDVYQTVPLKLLMPTPMTAPAMPPVPILPTLLDTRPITFQSTVSIPVVCRCVPTTRLSSCSVTRLSASPYVLRAPGEIPLLSYVCRTATLRRLTPTRTIHQGRTSAFRTAATRTGSGTTRLGAVCWRVLPPNLERRTGSA